MGRKIGACLVCGGDLKYLDKAELMACHICHTEHMSNIRCEDGHFICDDCHIARGIDFIVDSCLSTKSRNPIIIAKTIMSFPYIYIHGPEHHVLVGASLLAAYANSGGEINLEEAMVDMVERGKQVPFGVCGLHGCCGAAVSTGIFFSIITDCNPLKEVEWQNANTMTATALKTIARHGGPRCCKRESFLAIEAAVEFTKDLLGVEMKLPKHIVCDFFDQNFECTREKCKFYPNDE